MVKISGFARRALVPALLLAACLAVGGCGSDQPQPEDANTPATQPADGSAETQPELLPPENNAQAVAQVLMAALEQHAKDPNADLVAWVGEQDGWQAAEDEMDPNISSSERYVSDIAGQKLLIILSEAPPKLTIVGLRGFDRQEFWGYLGQHVSTEAVDAWIKDRQRHEARLLSTGKDKDKKELGLLLLSTPLGDEADTSGTAVFAAVKGIKEFHMLGNDPQ